MAEKKHTDKGMSDFELGSFLAKLDTKIDGLTGEFKHFVSMFSEVHKYLEERVRKIENDHVVHKELKDLADKHESLKNLVWRITVIMAAGGVGGTALMKLLN